MFAGVKAMLPVSGDDYDAESIMQPKAIKRPKNFIFFINDECSKKYN